MGQTAIGKNIGCDFMRFFDKITEKCVDVEGETITVGRQPGNDLLLPPGENRIALYGYPSGPVILGQTVSRHHAKIHAKDWGTYIEDLGSTGGTRVNEEYVRKGVVREIKPGDVIRFGSYVLEFKG